MILDKETIRERLYNGEVFKDGTWVEESIKEASYALRVASDGLLLRGKRYKPNEESIEGRIEIKPGEIAILSTIERLDMPGDLVGKLGIRFDYATQGLTGLMGIQVDPYFGWGHEDERLYIRVANLGNETILIHLVPMFLRSSYTKLNGKFLFHWHPGFTCGTDSKMSWGIKTTSAGALLHVSRIMSSELNNILRSKKRNYRKK